MSEGQARFWDVQDRLREGLIDPNNTASDVWADTAYRAAENERYLASIGRVSRIHRREPRGRSMARHRARTNAAKSAVRAHVEHPFAHQKGIMGLVIGASQPSSGPLCAPEDRDSGGVHLIWLLQPDQILL